MIITHPATSDELLTRAQSLASLSVGELAHKWQAALPPDTRHHKGWMGQLLEIILGTTSGNKPQPDFDKLGIELKTIPINPQGRPTESTFICSASLTQTLGLTWHDSSVYQKLKKILWIPIITTYKAQALADRTLGQAVLWEPSPEQEEILQADWEEIMEMICLGDLAHITAHHGTYLQLRPKAAHSHILCEAIGEDGAPILTLPRGFYLRATFTEQILRTNVNNGSGIEK